MAFNLFKNIEPALAYRHAAQKTSVPDPESSGETCIRDILQDSVPMILCARLTEWHSPFRGIMKAGEVGSSCWGSRPPGCSPILLKFPGAACQLLQGAANHEKHR